MSSKDFSNTIVIGNLGIDPKMRFTGAGKPVTSFSVAVNDSYVGSEVDLVFTWQMNRYAVFEAAYCHFFRGDYIQDSLSRVGSQDADYVYVQAQVNF